jgi:hypothetical protein
MTVCAGSQGFANCQDLVATVPSGSGTTLSTTVEVPIEGGKFTLTSSDASVRITTEVLGYEGGASGALVPVPVPVPVPTGGKPGPSNTGVPAGTPLTVHNGDLNITTPGAVVDGLDIRGFVRIKADNVTIRNSIIRGAATSSPMALVSGADASHRLTIEDTEIYAASPSPYIHHGVLGSNFTLRRVNIHHAIDQVHVVGDNVRIESSWLHDNLHFDSDANHGGGPSHDDNVQIIGGRNITVTGSTLEDSYGAGIQITQNKSLVGNVQITKNWANNGGCTINVAESGKGSIPGIVVADNTFGRNTRVANCAIISPTSTSISNARNFFTDGGIANVLRG